MTHDQEAVVDMPALAMLLRVASFRSAVEGLLRLPPGDRRAVREGRSDAREETGNTLDGQHFALMVAAYDALCRIRSDIGIDALLSEAQLALSADFPNIREILEDLLYEDPEEAERRIVDEVQRSALPVLQRIVVESDFRCARFPDDQVKLVPISVVRLEFDEMVGGAEAITFQISPEKFAEVTEVIGSARDLRARLQSAIPAGLLAEGAGENGQ